MTLKHRHDIDGLRAVAVLSVILFHSGFEIFSGGYVGVDVFFLISGYLITGIIVGELEAGNFSLARFYERRCRRILPALFVVVIFCLALGYLLQYPEDLLNTGKSAAASALFYSNILFNSSAGYFDLDAEQKPLLHTWSLSIEEQYYILYPLLLMLIVKYGARRYPAWLLALLLGSLVSGIVMLEVDSDDAFYLLPYRAWELLMGGLLAIGLIPPLRNNRLRETCAAIGLCMVLGSVVFFTAQTPFPGYAALLPTVGTAMMLHSGASGATRVASLLALRPLVFVGLISYSLYLWHWPIIVYTGYYSILEPGLETQLAMLALIFCLAVLSWKFVEQPVRNRDFLQERKKLLRAAIAGILAVAAVGFTFKASDGFPLRYARLAQNIPADHDPVWKYWKGCGDADTRLNDQQALCRIGDELAPAEFLVWGDSHARALAHGIDIGARLNARAGEIAYRSGCPVLLGVTRRDRIPCAEFNDRVLQYLADNPQLKTVMLVSRWPIWVLGTRFKSEGGTPLRLLDLHPEGSSQISHQEIFEAGLIRIVNQLRSLGRQVVVVTSIPEVGYNPPAVDFVTSISGRDTNQLIAPAVEEYALRTAGITRMLARMSEAGLLQIIDPSALLCDDRRCNVVHAGKLLYFDDDHLSTYGSAYVAAAFAQYFSEPELR